MNGITLTYLLAYFVPAVLSHTWIDCIDHNRSVAYNKSGDWIFSANNGPLTCEGQPRGYPGRNTSDINTEFSYQIPRSKVEQGAPVCQFPIRDAAYSAGWLRMLHAKPGDEIFLSYLPNGHVAKDTWGKLTRFGIYWSGVSDIDLNSTLDLAGKMVDGKLHYYDDGNCGETFDREGNPSYRAGDFHPCVTSFKIPLDTVPGTYQFVWLWKFYYEQDQNLSEPTGVYWYAGTAFSTCFDIVVQSES